MGLYIIFYALLIILTIISIRPKNNPFIYGIAVTLIIILAAFRGNGYDWFSYQDIYINLQKGGEQSGVTFVEYGFQILCLLSPTYRALVFIVAVLSLIVTLRSVYPFSRQCFPVLGLLIFSTTLLMPTYMGQIRQGLAMGFVCWAISDNFKDEKKKAILLIVVACLFHVSAILASVILIVPQRRFSLRVYVVIMAVGLGISTFFFLIIAKLLALFQIGIIQKLIFYASNYNSELGISSTIIIRIVTLLLAVSMNRDRDPRISYICNIYLCGIMVYLVFGFLPMLGGRGSLYFTIYEMILVPFIVYQLRKHPFWCISGVMIVIGLSCYRLLSFFNVAHNYSCYVPYQLN